MTKDQEKMLRQWYLDAKERAFGSGYVSGEIPNLDDIREAFAADEIDAEQLEALTEAAVFGEPVRLPPPIWRRAYQRRTFQVRFI